MRIVEIVKNNKEKILKGALIVGAVVGGLVIIGKLANKEGTEDDYLFEDGFDSENGNQE